MLTVPEEAREPQTVAPSEDATAQDSLRQHDSIAVTFSPNLAHNFPSLRLLLPGDPLFNHLSKIIQAKESDIRQDSATSFVALPEDNEVPVKVKNLDSIDPEVVAPVTREENVDSIGLNTYSEQSANSVLKKWGEIPHKD